MGFRYCLNTSTIAGQKLTLEQEIEITARAGYSGIEPWIRQIDDYVKPGRPLKDLGRRIEDAGLVVESAIGFFEYLVDDEPTRRRGLDEAKRNFELMAAIGGRRIAAPPVGAHQHDPTAPPIPLAAMAERYAALLELARHYGVVPMLEMWGFSRTLNRLGEVAYVATEAGHPDACLLLDVYHLYKGGSPVEGLRMLNGQQIPVFHLNDYPDLPPAQIQDKDRVYPGDGIAPLRRIFSILRQIGFDGAVSVELFNEDYYRQDPLTVATTALQRARRAMEG